MQVQVMDHPLIQHKVTLMRKKETGSTDFRNLLEEITMLMGYEITRDLPLEDIAIETPVAPTTGKQISGKKLGIVPVLRAGLGAGRRCQHACEDQDCDELFCHDCVFNAKIRLLPAQSKFSPHFVLNAVKILPRNALAANALRKAVFCALKDGKQERQRRPFIL